MVEIIDHIMSYYNYDLPEQVSKLTTTHSSMYMRAIASMRMLLLLNFVPTFLLLDSFSVKEFSLFTGLIVGLV